MSEIADVPPHDGHNETLVSNVRPPAWESPEPAPCYNLVVIGAGSAGLITALGAAGLGARVALVERHLLGGDCLNVGCVPSKCLIRSSRAYADARDAARYGVCVPDGIEIDFPGVMERMRRLRARISAHDAAERLRQEGVDVFFGDGRFAGAGGIEIEDKDKVLRFKRAVIATGARAFVPPIEGLAEAGFLTNETVFTLTKRPGRLAVIGAGPLGCELAQAFQRLGSAVTLIGRGGQVLPREDGDVVPFVAGAFARDGIALELGCDVTRVARAGDEKQVHFIRDGQDKSVTVDEILVAAGRAPNVEGLNLDAVGVDHDKKRGVLVNDRLRTTHRRVYAAGDVCLKYKFTHSADASARIVIQNALFWGRRKVSALTIPWCTYTDPEVAHVGLSETEAGERGIAVRTFARSLSEVDRAIADGEEEGLVKIHVKRGTDKILGATIVGRHAGEMINEITLAMVEGIGLGKLANVIHPYPTQAEAIKQAADAYNRTRLTPFLRGLFARFLSWSRR
ncbi:MAG: mercuric reductase [Planctomycetes bacterium]|nr:mercuric reductase [Planctomycetota bacterium]